MLLFWLFMLLMTMLIPAAMLICGRRLQKAPGARNAGSGYRTSRSMRSDQTWVFAQRLAGRLWIASGAVLMPLAALAMLFCLGRDVTGIGIRGAAVTAAESVVMAGMAIPVECALKRNFDENGAPGKNRK